ncbi:MAG: histidine kinase [Pseudomonadota bacterium]
MIDRALYRPLLLVSCTVWIGFLLIYVGISLFEGGLPADLSQRIVTYSFSATLSFGAGILTFNTLATDAKIRWAIVFAIAVATLLAHAAFGVAFYLAYPPYPFLEGAAFLPLFRNGIIYDSPIVSSVFIGFIAIHYGRQLAEQQRLVLIKDNAARDAQLATLRHQLSPHFLFNTLNSISALIAEGDNNNAQKTVLMLSDFLRFSLETDAVKLVPLHEELETLNAYLAIEHVRYEDRLQLVTEIDSDAKSVLVPPFLLQPLFENIIKHAVTKVSRPVRVRFVCSFSDDALHITIDDDGPGLCASRSGSTGTGLANLKQRLHLIYGKRARLDIDERSSQGFSVKITIRRGSDELA